MWGMTSEPTRHRQGLGQIGPTQAFGSTFAVSGDAIVLTQMEFLGRPREKDIDQLRAISLPPLGRFHLTSYWNENLNDLTFFASEKDRSDG